MNALSNDRGVTISLNQDEALVLFEWLTGFNESDQVFADQAEQRVLWDVEAMLEESLVAPFSNDYERLLAEARARVRDLTD